MALLFSLPALKSGKPLKKSVMAKRPLVARTMTNLSRGKRQIIP